MGWPEGQPYDCWTFPLSAVALGVLSRPVYEVGSDSHTGAKRANKGNHVSKFSLALVSVATAASTSAIGSPLLGMGYQSAPNYFTTQPSTPAGSVTAYNQRHRPEYGGPLDGVARLILNVDTTTGFGTLCSGALLSTGMHVLTAAHCVTDSKGVLDVDLTRLNQAQFGVTQQGATAYQGLLTPVAISAITVHSGWTGNYLTGGNDLAILTLAAQAPAGAARYDIYRGSDEFNQVTNKVGWGTIGLGSTGASIGTGWRTGQNTWDMTARTFWDGVTVASDNILMYDFDNGRAANDAMGAFFGPSYEDLGLGDMEVISGQGDSGGPSFINGMIAGITSFGLAFYDELDAAGNPVCFQGNPDFVCGLNNTFGEFAGDTRVSAYAAWIDRVTGVVPTPGTLPLALLAGVAFFASSRRRAAL